MKKLLLLLLLSIGFISPIYAEELELDTHQNNQVQQVAGQVYHIYSPELNTRVRQKPSLGSRVLALLNNDDRNHEEDVNHKDYKYAPYDEEWMKVLSSFDGKLLGYSHRSLFTSSHLIRYEDTINTPEGDYRLEFVGHPHKGEMYSTYRRGNYYYRITKGDGELVYEQGWGSERRHLNEGFMQEGELLPTQFHTLTIQDKKVGWLFGWNSWEDIEYDLDFSFARIFVPLEDSLYNESHHGLKFKTVADLRERQENQLLITPTKTDWDESYSNAGSPKYAIPYDVLITLSSNLVKVIDEY